MRPMDLICEGPQELDRNRQAQLEPGETNPKRESRQGTIARLISEGPGEQLCITTSLRLLPERCIG